MYDRKQQNHEKMFKEILQDIDGEIIKIKPIILSSDVLIHA